MNHHLSRRALAAGLIATMPLPVAAYAEPAGDRISTCDAFWAQLPLPFTPAQAWARLSPATQSEIGAAVIGQALARYISGEDHAQEDQFLSAGLRSDAAIVAQELLNEIEPRLWALFPTLYGPDGDHPLWALAGGFAR